MNASAVAATARRIPELDALRGFVALIVVFHHVFVQVIARLASDVPAWPFAAMDFVQARNKLAVLTFFVLSGYAIAMATRRAPPVTRAALGHYAYRRFARIVPLFYLSLAWTALLGLVYAADGPRFALVTLAGNALFLQTAANARGNWFEPFGGNGPYWSLSYEAFYYAALPAALWLLGRGRLPDALPSRARLIALGLGGLVASLVLNRLAPSPFSNFLGLWIVWLVGYTAFDLPRTMRGAALAMAPAALTALGLSLLVARGIDSSTLRDAFSGCLVGLVFALTAMGGQWLRLATVRALRRWFVAMFERVGRGSYALYLLHFPLILALRTLSDTPWSALVASIAVLVPFAILACPWIERESALVLRRPWVLARAGVAS